MRVHLHTVCWNDIDYLDFFFRHYAPWVDHFFIHDDGSTDGSLDTLNARADVSVSRLERTVADSFVMSAKHIYDTSWHQSRGTADWVVVTNIDEHLFNPDMRSYLAEMTAAGVTAIPSLGYQMVERAFPSSDKTLARDCPMGAPWHKMSKLQMFRPDAIEATEFSPGRHKVKLQGQVVLPDRDEVCNLHYKYLGLDRLYARHKAQEARLLSRDRDQGWGHRYHLAKDALAADFEGFAQDLVNIHDITDHHHSHPEPRWWREAPQVPKSPARRIWDRLRKGLGFHPAA